MCINFTFLQDKKEFNSFSSACLEAEKGLGISTQTAAILSRRALELAVKWLYSFDEELELPYQNNLSSLINGENFRDLVEKDIIPMIRYIIKLGNVAVHTNKNITKQEAVLSLYNLYQFVNWIDYCYGEDYKDKKFDEKLLAEEVESKKITKEQEDLYEKLSSKDRKIEEIIKENQELRHKLTEKRKDHQKEYNFNLDKTNENETRKIYIDVELKLAGWDFNKDVKEEEEVEGMPNSLKKGFVDYVLYGDNGLPLALIEAKRANIDAKNGRQQAKLYADCLEKKHGIRPIIFLTNGFETYLWDDYNGLSERKVYGFFKKEKLKLMIDRRCERISLKNAKINPEISGRHYQVEAIISCLEELEKNKRKLLLVMATGTGKTRTAISLVDILTKHNWVKNILFLADRKALVDQAKKSFSKLLPNLALCNLLNSKEDPEKARMVFSTYPTIINAIDSRKTKDGKRLFTCCHFDLIIVDESHRSIYKKYNAIFDYFDTYLVGLTATPKDEVDKNTYNIFDMENGVPTYAYELKEAIDDKFLVPYRTLEIKSKIMEEGIKYDELSDEDKGEYEEKFALTDEIGEEIDSSAINNWLFNKDTIDLVLNKLMEKGLKVEGNEKLGKTIIFAKNHNHAEAVKERFNKLYPNLKSNYAEIIDNKIKYASSLIEDFSDKEKLPQVAISVDMLDTGIDIPEILNLVFFKKVRSKTKFWQMIGRGTRTCEDLLGIEKNKKEFLIFDFCNNFEFFKANTKGFVSSLEYTLSERIFNLRLDLIKELQNIRYTGEEYTTYRDNLIDESIKCIKDLNEEDFRVKMKLKYIHKYKNKDIWNNILEVSSAEIKEHVSPFINIEGDELAKRFDILMYTIEFGLLCNINVISQIKKVMATAEDLSKLGTVPEIKENEYIIKKVKESEFWENTDIFEANKVRQALRELLKYLEKKSQKIYYTDFEDKITSEIAATKSHINLPIINNLKNYRKKVEHYLKENENNLAIYKLRNNKKITKEDLKTLESILWEELGTKEDYNKDFGDMPVNKLVRKIVGLNRETANIIFSEFISNNKLNSKQIHFVKLIVDYIVKNGFIDDNKVLMEDPFRRLGDIFELFKDNIQDIQNILSKVSEVKDNAETVI